MMRRLFWLGAGIAVGALVVRAVTKRAHSFTPRGLAAGLGESAGNLVDSVRGFLDDVREGMAEREAQIHAAFAEGIALDDEALDDEDLDDEDLDDEALDDLYRQEGKNH